MLFQLKLQTSNAMEETEACGKDEGKKPKSRRALPMRVPQVDHTAKRSGLRGFDFRSFTEGLSLMRRQRLGSQLHSTVGLSTGPALVLRTSLSFPQPSLLPLIQRFMCATHHGGHWHYV